MVHEPYIGPDCGRSGAPSGGARNLRLFQTVSCSRKRVGHPLQLLIRDQELGEFDQSQIVPDVVPGIAAGLLCKSISRYINKYLSIHVLDIRRPDDT